MKRLVSIIVAALLILNCLAFAAPASAEGKALKIVATIFPEYDWVVAVLGENPAGIQVTLLLDSGVDLHSYQPTPQDMLTVAECDLFLYVGGESDEWVEDALRFATNKDMVVLNLLEMLGDAVKEEELVEGMEHDHDHDHDEDEHDEHEHNEDEHNHDEDEHDEHEHDHDEHDHDEDEHDHDEHEHDHEHEGEYDEHVWLSLRNAALLVKGIGEAIGQIDPANADSYSANAAAYCEKLKALDSRYSQAVAEAPVKTLLFGDRFPFRYLVDDYGLSYYAAFSGCSAETEASFETVVFLAQKVNELKLSAVMTIEGGNHKIAETIVRSTKTGDQKILTLNSMQSVTARDVANGASYLAIMESNLAALQEALR
ncbi:MAG: zinc ABC transporter substrate-binding protein [Clostridia bacterium]|nr:zinc ABC transporter substrate-binding protein [Clostridia bacterium]